MAEKSIQYTVRGVPARVDEILRRQAREQRKSLNQLVLEVLEREALLSAESEKLHHDLDELAGTWVDDPEFDAALAAQDSVDEQLWK